MRCSTGWWGSAAGVLCLAAGCSTAGRDSPAAAVITSKNAVESAPATRFAPTDPSRVEFIPWAPVYLHHRLGEIQITPAPRSTRKDLETALRESAAALGAHAVFIVSDPRHQLEVVQVDPLIEEQGSRYPTNAIVAVAIRY